MSVPTEPAGCDSGGLGQRPNGWPDSVRRADLGRSDCSDGERPANWATDIGDDFGMPVSWDYTVESSKFNGKIELVKIDVG